MCVEKFLGKSFNPASTLHSGGAATSSQVPAAGKQAARTYENDHEVEANHEGELLADKVHQHAVL